MTLTKASRTAEDEQIFKWHKEAAGYKIRHVPATLPDMLKCKEMLEWEYGTHSNRSAQQAIGATKDQLTWLYDTPSDYEIALPEHELTNFLHQQGYYADMPKGVKDRQVAHLLGFAMPFIRVFGSTSLMPDNFTPHQLPFSDPFLQRFILDRVFWSFVTATVSAPLRSILIKSSKSPVLIHAPYLVLLMRPES